MKTNLALLFTILSTLLLGGPAVVEAQYRIDHIEVNKFDKSEETIHGTANYATYTEAKAAAALYQKQWGIIVKRAWPVANGKSPASGFPKMNLPGSTFFEYAKTTQKMGNENSKLLGEEMTAFVKSATAKQFQEVQDSILNTIESAPTLQRAKSYYQKRQIQLGDQGRQVEIEEDKIQTAIETKQQDLFGDIGDGEETLVYLENAEKEAAGLVDRVKKNVIAKGEVQELADYKKDLDVVEASLERNMKIVKKFVQETVAKGKVASRPTYTQPNRTPPNRRPKAKALVGTWNIRFSDGNTSRTSLLSNGTWTARDFKGNPISGKWNRSGNTLNLYFGIHYGEKIYMTGVIQGSKITVRGVLKDNRNIREEWTKAP